MRRSHLACIAFCLSAAVVPWAQADAPSALADGQIAIDQADPLTRPPFESAFSGYRSFDAYPEAADWRPANDEVGRLGGAMGHMRPMDDASREPSERTR